MKKLQDIIAHHNFLSHNIELNHHLNPNIHCVSANSKNCANGLFVAKKGATKFSKDGHDFIDEAIKNQAAAIIVDKSFPLKPEHRHLALVASHSELAYPHLCEAFFDEPSKKLKLIGITGTNGKTSVSFMLYSILKQAGFKVRIMGTLGIGEPDSFQSSSHTTLEAELCSAVLADFVKEKVDFVIMEVSSHALALNRVLALNFAAVGFTNLSQDHLDFHESMQAYLLEKKKLFWHIAKNHCHKLLPKNHPFGENYQGDNWHIFDEPKDFYALNLIGDFHQKNAHLSAQIATVFGIDLSLIKEGLKNCPPVPGRLELITQKPCSVFVDFAHTPDALSNVLKNARKLDPKKLIVVFGCGGNRDAKKRSIMGALAEDLADLIVITDDNPRFEDPKLIREQILAGMKNKKAVLNIADRKEAISVALSLASREDIVIIAGKGHENYQIYGDKKLAFSDQEEVKKAKKKYD